jgi:hypothetical protein
VVVPSVVGVVVVVVVPPPSPKTRRKRRRRDGCVPVAVREFVTVMVPFAFVVTVIGAVALPVVDDVAAVFFARVRATTASLSALRVAAVVAAALRDVVR